MSGVTLATRDGRATLPGRHRQPTPADAWLMRVAMDLRHRGVDVCARDLADRLPAEVMRAHAWAQLGESDRSLPAWLRPKLTRSIDTSATGTSGAQLSLNTERTTS